MENGKQGYPLGQVFETQYYGQCFACKGEVNPGDAVFYATQDALIHKTCPQIGLKLPIDGSTDPEPAPEPPVEF